MSHACCTENTTTKHMQFDAFMKIICGVWKGIEKKYISAGKPIPSFEYIDLNAGPGIYPEMNDYEQCSPLISISHVLQAGLLFASFHFVEKEPRTFLELQNNINVWYPHVKNVFLHNQDNYEFAEEFCCLNRDRWNRFGLVFADPSGMGRNEFLALIEFSNKFKKIDLAIHMQPANMKRGKQHSVLSQHGYLGLNEYKSRINKKYFLIRKPQRQQQFSFLFCSNWANFPDWKKQGFYRLESSEGKKVWDDLTEIKKEGLIKHENVQN